MGIAVPSQLRKATQPRNPSPPLPLLPPPPLPPRLATATASASTTPTPLPASSSRSEAPPSQTPQPPSRPPPLTTWQPRPSTADMVDTDTADTGMEATESALLRLGAPITSLWFPSVVVFAQPWVLLPPHPELSFHASPQSSKPSLLLTSKRASARLRLSLGTDGGDSVVPPLPEVLLLSDRTQSLLTTLLSRRVPPGPELGSGQEGGRL